MNFNIKTLPVPPCALGESPVWDYKQNKLYWVDIENCLLHMFNPDTQEHNSIKTEEHPGSITITKSGNILLALQNSISELNFSSRTLKKIIPLEKNIHNNRSNDGKCDPAGRLWIGTMDMNLKKSAGSLYCMNPDYSIKKIFGDISISNGMAWDNNIMYYTDTYTRKIQAFDYDIKTGNIINPRAVIKIPAKMGFPDGFTLDHEGMLWVAHWGYSHICRWNPHNGKLLDKINLPVKNITSCTFGGPELDTLFITTAQEKEKPGTNRNITKSGGSVYYCKPGYTGYPVSYFG